MATINAQTIINTLRAAALVAPAEHDAHTWDTMPAWAQYSKAAPWGFEGDAEFQECIDCTGVIEYGYRGMHAAQAAGSDLVTAAACQVRALLNVPKKIKIQTSARGFFTLQNTRERLEEMAATVKRGAAQFGGGLDKPAKRAPGAITWPATALKVAKELIESHDYAGALDIGADKLGALFYIGGKGKNGATTFAVFAPVPCDAPELCGLHSGMREDGTYTVFDVTSGVGINGYKAARTRAGAIDTALQQVARNSKSNLPAAIEKARTNYQHDQAAALALWKTERGIVEAADIEAQAAATVAAMLETAQEAATQASEAAALVAATMVEATPVEVEAAQVAPVAALVGAATCQAGAQDAAPVASMGQAIIDASLTLQRITATWSHNPTLRAVIDCGKTGQLSEPGPVINQLKRIAELDRSPLGREEARKALEALEAAQVAPVATATARTPRGALMATTGAGAQWAAVLKPGTGGAHALQFKGDGGAWEPTTEHATRRERAAALRALVQKNADNVAGFDDSPEDDEEATQAPGQASDYTTPRETSGGPVDGLHDTPRDLEAAPDFVGRGTYSPEDNKLRLYPFARLDAATYARMKAHGYSWAPKQELFVAPAWSPARVDLLQELCGEIEDEDSTMTERAAQRADRFDTYHAKRTQDAQRAYEGVHAIGARFELGQPILIGHHSEKRARKDKERMDQGMRRAVQMWDTAEYWTARADSAVRHAQYLESPGVRARRIKTLEADQRKQQRAHDEAAHFLKAYTDPAAQGATLRDGRPLVRALLESWEGGLSHDNTRRLERGELDPAQALEMATRAKRHAVAHYTRWIDHLKNRITYERAMLANAGGTVADQVKPEKGGAVLCWVSRGWSIIQKVNRITVTVLDNWGNGGRDFTRNIELDKLQGVMTRAQVDQARAAGRLANETPRGFQLMDATQAAPVATDHTDTRETSDTPAPELHDTPRDLESAPALDADKLQALRATLKAGGAVVAVAPQLFPTPPALAARMVELANIERGALVLEPSAGTGNLLAALYAATECQVHAVEINATLARTLGDQFYTRLARVFQADFLSWTPPDSAQYDAILMNPPFVGAVDIKHINRALQHLKPGGTLVAICAGGPRQAAQLRPLVEQYGGHWEALPAGTFESSGTGVNTVLLSITTPAPKLAPPPTPTDYTTTRETSTMNTEPKPLHDTPQDLAPAFQKLPAQVVDLAHILATGAPAAALIGMGVTMAGTDLEGAIVGTDDDTHAGGALCVDVVTEDGVKHEGIDSARFGDSGPGSFHINLKRHGAPYLSQLGAAFASRQAQASAARATMADMTKDTTTMTGAELQTLRESCGLSRDEFAGLADVQARTVKHWETRKGSGVPADAAALATELESAAHQAIIAHTERAILMHAPQGKDTPVILTRYREGTTPDPATWGTTPASMQGAIVAGMRLALLARGFAVRVVLHDADYTTPRETLEAQAVPHRADQPPTV